MKLIEPFRQIITMRELPLKGALADEQLDIIKEGGIVVNDTKIEAVGNFKTLHSAYPNIPIHRIETDLVAFPGMIDAHTHLCFAGSRAMDFAARNNGKTYLEIAKAGGGIWSTVQHTRKATEKELVDLMKTRLNRLLHQGVTTVEIKSGYGLSVEEELKQLRAIRNTNHVLDIIPTCLAAHIVPRDMEGGEIEHLNTILNRLVPQIQQEKLCNRFDIFIEESAFSIAEATRYLKALKQHGFDLTVHGDQFSVGGSQVAIDCGALSVDHLEVSGEKEIAALAKSDTIAVALPGASIGIGYAFTPARKLLDAGASLAIASDWNPGSAPQGNLLMQAAVLSTFEKLSAAEVWAGMTFRAAKALGLTDRGRLEKDQFADIIAFPTNDYREVLYHQGMMNITALWKDGKQLI